MAGIVLGLAVLWSAILVQPHLRARSSVLDRVESSLLDWRILAFGPRPAPAGVLIAAIDDDTIHAAGAWPLSRRLLAEAVSRLLAAGAKAVLIDALFLDAASDPDDDAVLAAALAGKPAAVAAMVDFPPGGGAGTVLCRLPIPAIRRAGALGATNIALDASGIVRHVPMLLSCRGGLLPSLPLKGVALAAGNLDPAFAPDAVEIGGVSTPLDAGRHLALRFYGPEATIATVSLAALLKSETALAAARGRIVLIGATAHGVGDRYPTPFDSVLPGVEVMATALANLATGDALARTGLVRRLDAVGSVLLALALAASLTIERLGPGLLIGGTALAAWAAVVLIGFAHGIWFAMALPLAAALPAGVLAGAARLVRARWVERELRREHQALAGFHAPAILARLTADPDFLAQPVEREVVAVFIDLSGFTGLSERLGPRVTRDLLKQWHEIVEDVVAAGAGFVVSYMADGAMLLWGLAEAGPDDALRGVRSAVLLQTRTLAWLGAVEAVTGPLGVKLGGHCGPVSLSRLGHTRHAHITAIGDTVNVASRLMGVAAEARSTMALSADLVTAARAQGLDDLEASFMPPRQVAIRGRAQPIAACFHVANRSPHAATTP